MNGRVLEPQGDRLELAKEVDRQIVEILESVGHRLSKIAFLAEYDRRGRENKLDYIWSEQTVVNALARLNGSVIDNRQDTKPRGYGLPHWKDGGPNAVNRFKP